MTIAGATIARGAFDRFSMLNTVFHTNDPRLFAIIVAHAFGPTLFVIWLPAAIVGGFALVRRGWWPHAILALLPCVMALLFWFGLPVNIDSRFLMPAVPLAMLPLAFVFGQSRARTIVVHAIYVAAAVWILVGAHAELRPAAPWFMGGWLKLDGLLTRDAVAWWALLAILMTSVWWLAPKETRWAGTLVAALLLTVTTVVTLAGERWPMAPRGEYLSVTSPYLRANLIVGWRWMADHVHHATIAYTGINLPYPLAGDALTNRVIYVNIDGRPAWRFHDYDRAYRRGAFKPAPPLLATRSGELLPVSDRFGPALGAIRPRYERMQGVRDAWIDNLRRFHVDYLFVSSLSAYEIDNVWHDGRGFPIENEWAEADGGSFHLAYENPQVRVFAINLDEDGQ